MSAPTAKSPAPGDAQEAAEALALLEALARAPAAAALVAAALEDQSDRGALRVGHYQLRDAVGEAATKLQALFEGAAARPSTPPRWPRLEELTLLCPDFAASRRSGPRPGAECAPWP
jgi:hypothetical protein